MVLWLQGEIWESKFHRITSYNVCYTKLLRFAETGLGVSKNIGDLLGPCAFAVLMGISRTIYGVYGSRMNLMKTIAGSSILCVISYFIAVLSVNPLIALAGCALCGFSVGIMWPGVFSLSAKHYLV